MQRSMLTRANIINRKKVNDMKAIINNVDIRGCEAKTNKKGDPYLLVRLEDEAGSPAELVDKDMSRQQYYKRDTIGTLTIDIKMGKYTSIRIVDFKISQ